MSKIEELENLFEKWKNEHSKDSYNSPTIPIKRIDKNSFCRDGFVFDAKDNTVLYILAESNLQGENKSNDFFWVKGTYKIEENYHRIPKAIEEIQSCICNKISGITLEDISYMNINKRGGFSECDKKALSKYYEEYRKLILEEIKIINPKIIIFAVGNTEKVIINGNETTIYDDIKANVNCDVLNTTYHLTSSKFSIDEFKKIIDTELK